MSDLITPSQPAIVFDDVSKIYRLGGQHNSLRGALTSLWDRTLRKGQDNNSDATTLAALNQVSFEIDKGESVAFIGPNGSGKTTTLKLISNITRATQGTIRARGRLSALIELGAGFHAELSGRENIYFNAAILGMSRQEIQERFDEIVDFSGLEQFLDTPVKRYSSGMYCRLGFAVAAHVNPDILLVDEVLAVGDAAFQAKCLKRMGELRANGTTIIFVTHNLGYLQRLCNRAIFMYRGNVKMDGAVAEVIAAYRDHNAYGEPENKEESLDAYACDPTDASVEAGLDPDHTSEASPVRLTEVYYSANQQNRVDAVQTGGALTVHIGYEALRPVENANFELWLYGQDGTEYASFATGWDSLGPLELRGRGEVKLQIDPMCLMPGTYFVNVAISDQDGLAKYDMHWERHKVVVLSGPTSYGLVFQPHRWDVNGAEPNKVSIGSNEHLQKSAG